MRPSIEPSSMCLVNGKPGLTGSGFLCAACQRSMEGMQDKTILSVRLVPGGERRSETCPHHNEHCLPCFWPVNGIGISDAATVESWCIVVSGLCRGGRGSQSPKATRCITRSTGQGYHQHSISGHLLSFLVANESRATLGMSERPEYAASNMTNVSSG